MDAEVHALQFKLGMAYILGEDQLCLGVKRVLLVVLLNVIDDGDTGKHAYNLALGVEHLPDDQERKQIEMKRADFNHSCLFLQREVIHDVYRPECGDPGAKFNFGGAATGFSV
jgi:hypothetical protein